MSSTIRIRLASAALVLTTVAWTANAQNAGGGASANIATVGRLTIARNEMNDRFDRARAAYRERTGEPIPDPMVPTFRRTVLEQMIRARLLMLEAEREGLLVGDGDAEAELKRSPFFNEGGRFSQVKFDAAKRNNPQAFAAALEDARLRVSGSRMEQRVVQRHQPEEAKLRRTIARELTTATVDVLALPSDDFDGRGAEPTEREVLDAWRARRGRGAASLAETAPAIRAELRARRRERGGDAELRALYDSMREALRGPAARMKYAFFDTAHIALPAPARDDLDRFYRGHLADYSSFDASRGEIRRKPLDEVIDDVRQRWAAERRVLEARAAGERLLEAWTRGRTDRRAEKEAALLRDTPPVAVGLPVDTLRFGRLLGDTLAGREAREGAAMIEVPGGILVFSIHDRRTDFLPPFEAVHDRVEAARVERARAEERAAARRMFDAQPLAFARDSTLHFSRMVVPQPMQIDVPLTRAEVERYHREHLERYSSPEVVAARDILIAPTGPGPEADAAARQKAEGLLERIRKGEDFSELARQYSDDARTRASGGDLGSFGRGAMHPVFEQAAFALRPGETSEPVRTPEGWHLIRCTAYEPVAARPLAEVYTNVGFDAATEKAKVIARAQAESLLRVIRTPEDAKRIASERHYIVYHNHQPVGTRGGDAELSAFFSRLDHMKPGDLYPLPVTLRGQGSVIAWMDSITPPRSPSYAEVEEEVLDEYRRRTGALALEAKRKELEALERDGWSVDSLAALFGGWQRTEDLRAGDGLPRLGGGATLDSLVFGDDGAPALAPGRTSGWVAFPGGLARVRLVDLDPPGAEEMAARLDRERRKALERNLFFYFEDLKRRFAVQIRDPVLASIHLPPPGESPAP